MGLLFQGFLVREVLAREKERQRATRVAACAAAAIAAAASPSPDCVDIDAGGVRNSAPAPMSMPALSLLPDFILVIGDEMSDEVMFGAVQDEVSYLVKK